MVNVERNRELTILAQSLQPSNFYSIVEFAMLCGGIPDSLMAKKRAENRGRPPRGMRRRSRIYGDEKVVRFFLFIFAASQER